MANIDDLTPEQAQAMLDAREFLRKNRTPGQTNFLGQSMDQNPNFGVEGVHEVPKKPFVPPITPNPTTGVLEAPRGLESKEQTLRDIRQLGDALVNESLPIAGAITGGILGGPGGAALGAAGGEGFKQVGQNFGFFGGNAPETSIEAAERLRDEALIGGAGELGGRVLVKTGQKLGRGFSKSITSEGDEALKFFKGSNITLNPAKVTDSRLLDVASNAGEASFVSGDKFLKGQLRAAEFVDDAVDDLISVMRKGGNRELTGNLVQDAIAGNSNAFKAKAGQLFNQLDDAIGGTARVDYRPLKAEAARFLEQSKAGVGTSGQRRLANEIIKKPDLATFSEAQTLRSTLLTRTRSSTDVLADQTIGMAKKLAGTVDNAMSSAADDVPGANKLWRKANGFWKKGKAVFNEKLIKNIAAAEPGQVSKMIFAAGKDRAAIIKKVRLAVSDTEAWRAIQGETMDRIIQDSLDPTRFGTSDASNIISKTLLKNINKFGGRDQAALKAMFPARQDKVLAKLARIKGVILKGQPDSTGRFAVQIGQISAAAALATGKFRKTAFSILLGPEAIARAFRSPTIAGLITEGLKINPATQQGLRQLALFTSRLAAQLEKEDIKHEIIQPTIQELFGSEEQVNSLSRRE